MKQFITVVLFVAVATCSMVPSIASAEVKFGILPRLTTLDIYAMFRPLEEYLTKETGEKVSIVTAKDFAAYKEMVRAGQVDLGFANPLIYIELKNNMDLTPLALASELKAGTKFRGIIIARKDSKINGLQDLKGKKLLFVDKDSAAGYIFQMFLLSKSGMDLHKDFVTLPFAKKHDNVTIAVINGNADAGGIREDDLAKMKGKVDISQLKIVGFTEYFPNWPVFATPRLNKDIAMKIQAALLKLKPKSPQSEKILGIAGLDGFATVKDKNYDELRKAAKLVGAY